MLSQVGASVCWHPVNEHYDTSHKKNSASVTEESDIIIRNKWWINEELHLIAPMIVPQIIIGITLNSKDILLGDCAMAFPSHVVDDFSPEKYVIWKIFIGIYFHILTQYKPIIERISACHGISIRIIIFRGWCSFCYDRFFFHMSHNDKILIIKHVIYCCLKYF